MKQDYMAHFIWIALVVMLAIALSDAENETHSLKAKLELLQKSCEGR